LPPERDPTFTQSLLIAVLPLPTLSPDGGFLPFGCSNGNEGETRVINSGDTAWVLTSTALVMLMTPGLALFYGAARTC
jgi:hypothetical protein